LKSEELRSLSEDHIFALLKPGHYDLIYQELNSSIQLINHLEIQAKQYFFLETIVTNN